MGPRLGVCRAQLVVSGRGEALRNPGGDGTQTLLGKALSLGSGVPSCSCPGSLGPVATPWVFSCTLIADGVRAPGRTYRQAWVRKTTCLQEAWVGPLPICPPASLASSLPSPESSVGK